MTGTTNPEVTRKSRREDARAQRRALEEATQARAARRRRLTQLGGIAAAAIAIVAVLVAISSSGGGAKQGISTGTQANQTVAAVASELSGVPQTGNTLGSPTAPVTIQYFGDLECPVCQSFTLGSLPQVIATDVRTGTAKIQYRSLQTATPSASTFSQQQAAALAAGKQNHMWDYVELFYNEQGVEDSGYVTSTYLQALASQIPGLNLTQWKTDSADVALANQVASDQNAASKAGLNSTPSLVISGKHGAKTLVGDATAAEVEQAIQSVR